MTSSPYGVNMSTLRKAVSAALVLALIASPAMAKSKQTTRVATGRTGQVLTVLNAAAVSDGQEIWAIGKNYNAGIGIYVAFCEMPAKGTRPDHCFGGININQSSHGSIWISSNPPFYGKFIATPYGPGGTFKVKIQVAAMIDSTDCRVTTCGIVTRADHTRGNYRKADVFVPVTFK